MDIKKWHKKIMTKIIENAMETFAIELLEKQCYQYIYAPVIALIAKNAEGKLQ